MNSASSDDIMGGKLSRRGILVFWWYMFGVVAAAIGSAGYSQLLRSGPRTEIFGVVPFGFACCRHLAVIYFFLTYYKTPFRCLGSFKRSMMEVLALSSALALRQLFEFGVYSLMALVGTTADLYVVAQSLHLAYDVGIQDVMLGSLMQIVIYLMGENVYAVTVVFTFCGGVTFYRFASYSPPVMPLDVEEELDKRLC